MAPEVRGSFFVMGALLAAPHLPPGGPPRWVVAAVFALLCVHDVHCAYFLLGMLVASRFDDVREHGLQALGAGGASDAGMLALAASAFLLLNYATPVHSPASLLWHAVCMVRVLALMLCLARCRALEAALSSAAARFLGRISFSLYICHSYILHLVPLYLPRMPPVPRAALSMAIALGLATATTGVDAWAIGVSKRVAQAAMGAPSRPAGQHAGAARADGGGLGGAQPGGDCNGSGAPGAAVSSEGHDQEHGAAAPHAQKRDVQ